VRSLLRIASLSLAVALCVPDSALARGSGLYDMSIFLNSPHPFAQPGPSAPPAPRYPPAGTPTPESYDEEDDALIDDLGPEGTAEDSDWLEPVNRTIFAANDIIYAIFLEPIAKLYQVVVPEFARTGVSNAVQNLNTPVILANDLMQGEFGRAWETTERFAVNTTVGLGGTIDVADKWLGIPPHKEDFGQTMAVWGVPEGGYLVVPFLGPSGPRAAFGRFGVDSFLDPLNLWLANTDRDKYVYLRTGVTAMAEYEAVMDELRELRETSVDYYATVRSLYRQRRAADIANGKAAVPDI